MPGHGYTPEMLEEAPPALDLYPLVDAVLDGYALSRFGLHGLSHWGRVLENGLRLAGSTGADARVVALFALFHDSRRINDGHDPGHGARGGRLAASLRGSLFELGDAELELLVDACARHTDGLTEADVTVQTCWDSDRLDLGRVGTRPLPELLCTAAARAPEMIAWAHRRAAAHEVPEWIARCWSPAGGPP